MKPNFNAWSYTDFVKFVQATQAAEMLQANALLAKVLPDYPTPDSLNDLDIETASSIKREIMLAIDEFIKGLDLSLVEVDFKRGGWTERTMMEFQDAQRTQDLPKLERMMKGVATLEGVTKDKPLTFAQGVSIVRAIQEAYKRLLSGK